MLLFDIQDIGARYYTYVYTMALAMEAAGEAGIPFVVLDRPNPIGGGRSAGQPAGPRVRLLRGYVPHPHAARDDAGRAGAPFPGRVRGGRGTPSGSAVGMEPGRLVSGHRASLGGAFAEHAFGGERPSLSGNLPVRRHQPVGGSGTPIAFQQIGAPWLDGEALAANLNGHGLAGVRFEAGSLRAGKPRRRQARWG